MTLIKSIIAGTLLLSGSLAFFSCSKKADPPKPYGALPTKAQVEWNKMERYMFVHFGPNTFTNKEWGNGKENPKVFNPTHVDCKQWAATAKAAGMKGIVLTVKHHDGFCLWPSQYSKHTVRESLWKNGKGDLIKELSDACKQYGLKFGIYISPWDRNHPAYGSPQYNTVYNNMLKEVLGNYGNIFELWFDGANGEGPKGKKQEYDWNLFHQTVHQLQPQAVMFSDIGPGCRWVGNENGFAGSTNWSRLNTEGFAPGLGAPPTDTLNIGNIYGKHWIPAEADVSIRPGWFYSPDTDNKIKSLKELLNIYYKSVGHNANLILNVPPDRNGRIHPGDSIRLMEFNTALQQIFKTNLFKDATITASNTRGDAYKASNLLDNNYDSYWATDDNVLSAELTIKLTQPQTFNRLLLQEYIPLGQRVQQFTVYYLNQNNQWKPLTKGTTIGYKRILRFPTVSAAQLKIVINHSLACPVLNNLGLYNAPEELAAPTIQRMNDNTVQIHSNSKTAAIYYTVDGSMPTSQSTKYTQPFSFAHKGVIKAIATDTNQTSEIASQSLDVIHNQWKVISPTTGNNTFIQEAAQAPTLIKDKQPIIISFEQSLQLKGFTYTPTSGQEALSHIYRYKIYASQNGKKWTEIKTDGIFDNIKNNPIPQNVLFNKTISARYLKLQPTETTSGSADYDILRIGVITK